MWDTDVQIDLKKFLTHPREDEHRSEEENGGREKALEDEALL